MDEAALFDVLNETALPPDAQWHETGIGLDRERALSSPFVATPDYGTRACSIVRVGRTGVAFVEQCHDASDTSAISRFAFGFSDTSI